MTVQLIGAGGVRLTADVVGDPRDPAVVLLHGGGQTRHSWGSTASALAERGWRAYTVDLRGHGESEWPADGDYSLDAFARDVAAVASSFSQLPVLVGASLGGIASLIAVGESPSPLVAALVLVDIAHRAEPAGSQRVIDFMRANMREGFTSFGEAADAITEYNPNRPRPADLSGLQKNLRQRGDGRWVWHWDPRWLSESGDTKSSSVEPGRREAAAQSLSVPVLLVRGRSSDVLSAEGAREFLELVPHAEFVDVEGAGHMVAGDRNDVFNGAIQGFLDRLRWSGSAAGS
jgi:pimeloyl-ACP methyl ester carboxylesterase